MRKRFQDLLDKLIKIAYYLIGLVVLIALMALLFDYKNDGVILIIRFVSFLYLECLWITLIVLKYYDLKDAIKEKRYSEFLPLGRSDLSLMALYIACMLGCIFVLGK